MAGLEKPISLITSPLSLLQLLLQYPHFPDLGTNSLVALNSVGHQSPFGSLNGFAQPLYSLPKNVHVNLHGLLGASPPLVTQPKIINIRGGLINLYSRFHLTSINVDH